MANPLLTFSVLSLLGLQLAGASPTPAPDASNLQDCALSMDGKLPSVVPQDFNFSGNVRRYYVAAEEVEWNYGPTGWDNWLGVPLNVSPRAAPLLDYNTTYIKGLYRGYTDSTFSEYTEQPAWQGTQGPTLRSEVGDLVEIMFVNKLSKAYATMHSMGLQYSKTSEGSDYPNVTMPGYNETLNTANAVPPVDAGVGPGNCAVYKWVVPDIAGPNADEPARTHSYHSYIDLLVDTNSGLIGPAIVYAPGMMNITMSTYREIPLLYMGYMESMSFLSGENAQKLLPNHSIPSNSSFGMPNMDLYSANASIWHPQMTNLGLSGQFSAAPQIFGLNGYFFANNPTFSMCQGDKVIWYVNAYGGESHVFHMHGHSIVEAGKKAFSVSLNDGTGHTLYMNATSPGLWQVVCHVNDHHQKGMLGNYRVYGEDCPLEPLATC